MEYIGRIETVENEFHYPIINIEIYNYSEQKYYPFEALIDTGFTDFLKMPSKFGIGLGLMLNGVDEFILANGFSSLDLRCSGMVKYEDMTFTDKILLAPSSTLTYCLAGMKFLEKFGLDLNLSIKKKQLKLIRND